MSDDNKTIDLAALSPEEREAWEVCQKAQYGAAHGFTTEAVEKALSNTARNLLPALLLKVARITREMADLTKEKDSALQERDAAMKSSDENHAKFVAADQACESAEQELSLLRSRKDYHGEYVDTAKK